MNSYLEISAGEGNANGNQATFINMHTPSSLDNPRAKKQAGPNYPDFTDNL